jgi:signal transduction histidine kinase
MNLIVNARDAMPEGGRLRISPSNSVLSPETVEGALRAAHRDYVMLAVSDTGTGMTPEVQQLLFDPVFHNEGAGKRNGTRALDGLRHRPAIGRRDLRLLEGWDRHFQGLLSALDPHRGGAD